MSLALTVLMPIPFVQQTALEVGLLVDGISSTQASIAVPETLPDIVQPALKRQEKREHFSGSEEVPKKMLEELEPIAQPSLTLQLLVASSMCILYTQSDSLRPDSEPPYRIPASPVHLLFSSLALSPGTPALVFSFRRLHH